MATLGVRLIGLAAVIVGVILSGSILVVQAIANSAPPVTATTLHDTYYTHVHYSFGLMLLPCVASIIVGIALIATSRSFARMLSHGISHDVV